MTFDFWFDSTMISLSCSWINVIFCYSARSMTLKQFLARTVVTRHWMKTWIRLASRELTIRSAFSHWTKAVLTLFASWFAHNQISLRNTLINCAFRQFQKSKSCYAKCDSSTTTFTTYTMMCEDKKQGKRMKKSQILSLLKINLNWLTTNNLVVSEQIQ